MKVIAKIFNIVEYVFDSHYLTFVSTMIYENTYYTKNYHYTLKVCTHKKWGATNSAVDQICKKRVSNQDLLQS